jgi:hypothetical protein
MYEVIVITNRNYGLYGAFATGILGLNTYVLYMDNKRSKTNFLKEEGKIWPHETKDDYLLSINKLNIPVKYVSSFFYNYGEDFITITTYETEKSLPEKFNCKNIIFALDDNHLAIPKQKVIITNLSFAKDVYVIGEKALYKNKIFAPDIYTGEANLVAQAIYQKIHNTKEMIVVHSTSLK